MGENTGTMVTVFLEELEGVTTKRELQEMFCKTYMLPFGEARGHLRGQCFAKAKEMGWPAPINPDEGDCD